MTASERIEQSSALAWAPGGDWVAFTAEPDLVFIERVGPSGREPTDLRVAHLKMHSRVQSLSVSRDGRWLAAGHADASVTIRAVDLNGPDGWREVSRGNVSLLFDPTHNDDAPTLVEFSPTDDTLVVVCGRLLEWLRVDVQALEAAARLPATASEAESQPQVSWLSLTTDREDLAVTVAIGDFQSSQHHPFDRSGLAPHVLRQELGLDARPVYAIALHRALTRWAQTGFLPADLLSDSRLTYDTAPLAIITDATTARYPWELLLRGPLPTPWAVERGLVRSMDQAPPRHGPKQWTLQAMVIELGRPGVGVNVDAPTKEAVHMAALLRRLLGEEVQLFDDPLQNDWLDEMARLEPRVLFIAGAGDRHGESPPGEPQVLTLPDGRTLSPVEFVQRLRSPEIVYLSCPGLASWAGPVLSQGVPVFVAPDWAVDSPGSMAFSEAFFNTLLAGEPLIAAARAARKAVYPEHQDSTAWATFQVHGDPLYRFAGAVPEAPAKPIDFSPMLASAGSVSQEEPVVQVTPGEDVLAMTLEDGPVITLHPENARELFAGQGSLPPPESIRGARGVGKSWLRSLQVLGHAGDGSQPPRLADVVTAIESRNLPSLHARYRSLGTDSSILTSMAAEGLSLVLIPGLLCDGGATFSGLWSSASESQHDRLFDHYRDQVYSLEYRTLANDPIDAALLLANSLPHGARLHLLTHSSGGLVAEALVRCTLPMGSPSTDAGMPPHWQDRIDALRSIVRDKALRFERVVRLACPVQGLQISSTRGDAFLSAFKWAMELAEIPVEAVLSTLLLTVARDRADLTTLPGIAALLPDSPLIRWLHEAQEPAASELRIVAGQLTAGSAAARVKALLSDRFYWFDNDLVVPTRSMYGGVPRQSPATYFLNVGAQVSHFRYFQDERTLQAIVDGLLLDAPPQFSDVGSLSWTGESPTGSR